MYEFINNKKIIVCSKTNPVQLNINIENKQIRHKQQFTYLGCNITKDGHNVDIICRTVEIKSLPR